MERASKVSRIHGAFMGYGSSKPWRVRKLRLGEEGQLVRTELGGWEGGGDNSIDSRRLYGHF